ncbi:transcriptional protein SWT1-like isoform X2 [Portunus trituberculatus]|uniref:transcriptional protein SWT1-like isoform X2 n=1 Tax=Portunus trituberculatus TaxID=210409 RepID=UPI001E1D0F88|nr:transcriptional protein SWT1-like isoform X2 [Portunus trituberculatus]
MTSSNNKEELPPHWIVKTSRQYPSLSYYANVKTGQSSWKHPSLMKESELKKISKIKDKKKSRKNVPGVKKADEEEQEKSPSKGNFIPIGSDRSSAAVGSTQVLKDDAGDGKGLKTKEESNINSKNDKSKKVKFTISKRNVLSTFPKAISSPKKSVALHPSILLAQKIATRDSHLNVKRKVEDKKDKQSSHAEVQRAKKIKSNKESLKPSVAVSQTAGIDTPTTSENCLKTKESNEAEESNRSIPSDRKKEFKRKKKQKHKRHKEESPFHQVEKDKSSIKKHEEDTGKTESEVDQVYRDFVARKSKLWQINRYSSHQGQSAGTLHLELLRDGDHNEIPSAKVRPEEKHEEEEEEKEEEASVSSKEVPYTDSPKVSRPTLVQSEDSAYPKVTEMEIDEAELNMEIANFRVSASYSRLAVSEDVSNSNTCLNFKSLYFVVDTNVLIGDIDLLEELKSTSVNGQESVVLVPYVVLQEMDGLKKSPAIGQACQVAVRWCNQHFEKQHRRVQGQTYSNYRITVEENKRASADDLVRDCCLLLAREGLDVCLLTNDVNLRNKALMSNLSAFSAKDLRSKLRNISAEHVYGSPEPSLVLSKCEESNMKDVSLNEVNSVVSEAPPSIVGPRQHPSQLKHRPDQKVKRPSCSVTSEDTLLLERITTSLHHTLSNILQDVMKEIYEDLWMTIIIYKPPWNLKDLFACWEKHWIAAMTDRFPSRVKELLAEINKLLTISQVDVQKLLALVQQLYSYFKSKPYSKHVLPVQDSSLIVDMSEAPLSQHACSTPPCADGVEDSCQPSTMSGVINVEKMINQVGAHITHFVCLNERTSSALQDLGHMLSNFWSEAHLPCPHLPFTECDLRQFVESPNSAQYLGCVLQELESLVQQLTPILATL